MVAVGVAVGVFVGVFVAAVGVAVGVSVATPVFVGVGVLVGVFVAPGEPVASVTNSCGSEALSREEKVTPSFPSAIKAKVYIPFPDTRAVTSYSTQVLPAIAPLLSNALLNKAGLVSQVTPPAPDSIQLLSAR